MPVVVIHQWTERFTDCDVCKCLRGIHELWLTCPFCHRCLAPVRPPLTTALSLSCSWCWNSWPHTSPDPVLSSGTLTLHLLCVEESIIMNKTPGCKKSVFKPFVLFWFFCSKTVVPEYPFMLFMPHLDSFLPLTLVQLVLLQNPGSVSRVGTPVRVKVAETRN